MNWDADDEEGAAPAEGLVDPAADEHAEHDPERNAQRVDAERGGAFARRVVVRDQRMRRRAAAGLADADADARDGQLPEVLRHAGQCRHRAPQGQREADEIAPVAAIGPQREGDAEGGVEGGEGEAGEEAERLVGELEVGLDRLDEDGKDLAVDEIEGVDHYQHEQDVTTYAQG